jgi:phytoene dehydrogenase-like protein
MANLGMVNAERSRYDAIVIGSGPNGLAAAVALARDGWSVLVLERRATVGGGTRSAELTLPGFVSDVCAAVHPLGVLSPFFHTLPLREYGLEWVQPPAPLAHPLDGGTAVMLERSVDATAALLGPDSRAYHDLMAPLVADTQRLVGSILGPLRLPRHPIALARFGLSALRSTNGLARATFEGHRARALFAGMAAHSLMPLEQRATAAFGLVLGLTGHVAGWPIARGGSQAIADALAGYLRALGGEIVTEQQVRSLGELPSARAVIFDTSTRDLLSIAGDALPGWYRRQLDRYRYGHGVFKIDWALSGPIPWTARECTRAATVHLGGSLEEIAASERAMARGAHIDRPFVLLAQQSLFDTSRAPAGKQVAWGYCHVPAGSTVDMTARVEAQVERYAPGFRDLILARHTMTAAQMEDYNPNYLGGDINGGLQDLRQLFTRPVPRYDPYSTPNKRLYLCSSATPPGGGVHGLCGFFAAQSVMRRA